MYIYLEWKKHFGPRMSTHFAVHGHFSNTYVQRKSNTRPYAQCQHDMGGGGMERDQNQILDPHKIKYQTP